MVRTKASYLYREDNRLSDKTICMSAQLGDKNQFKNFDVHNLYGLVEAMATMDVAKKLTNTRGLVISKVTFVGSGKYGGHWLTVILTISYLITII